MGFYVKQTTAIAHPEHGHRIVVHPGDEQRDGDDPLVRAHPDAFEERVPVSDAEPKKRRYGKRS